ncbi:hypothetical protein BH23ACT7_BH23ACT7_10330 [soil metagenome]
MTAPPYTRRGVPTTGGERDLLVAFLDFQRETLQWRRFMYSLVFSWVASRVTRWYSAAFAPRSPPRRR